MKPRLFSVPTALSSYLLAGVLAAQGVPATLANASVQPRAVPSAASRRRSSAPGSSAQAPRPE